MKIIFCYLIFYGIVSFSMQGNNFIELNKTAKSVRTETFKFFSNGESYNAKIHLPAAYDSVKNLPAIAIFLIDFTEQHFKLDTDEFEKVIDGVAEEVTLRHTV